MAKCIDKDQNSSGAWFALVQNDDLTYKVMKLCSNYDGKVLGGISKTWRYVDNRNGGNKMAREDANNLFIKRLNGTQK